VAAQLVKKMVGAIRYCHEHHIAHRDLKLENFLFENDSPEAELKLIDFGEGAKAKSEIDQCER
jgi:calcium-dependent protein kinase